MSIICTYSDVSTLPCQPYARKKRLSKAFGFESQEAWWYESISHAKGTESNGVIVVCTERVYVSDESNVNVTETDNPHLLHQAPKLYDVVRLNSNRPSGSKALPKLLVEALPELILVPSACVTARIAAPITLVV